MIHNQTHAALTRLTPFPIAKPDRANRENFKSLMFIVMMIGDLHRHTQIYTHAQTFSIVLFTCFIIVLLIYFFGLTVKEATCHDSCRWCVVAQNVMHAYRQKRFTGQLPRHSTIAVPPPRDHFLILNEMHETTRNSTSQAEVTAKPDQTPGWSMSQPRTIRLRNDCVGNVCG
jgi:hypothetical protein